MTLIKGDLTKDKRISRNLSAALFSSLMMFVGNGTLAAEISCTREGDGVCTIAALQGEIVEGDYQKFVTFYRQHHPALFVDEAIKIGRLFRRYLIQA